LGNQSHERPPILTILAKNTSKREMRETSVDKTPSYTEVEITMEIVKV